MNAEIIIQGEEEDIMPLTEAFSVLLGLKLRLEFLELESGEFHADQRLDLDQQCDLLPAVDANRHTF